MQAAQAFQDHYRMGLESKLVLLNEDSSVLQLVGWLVEAAER